MQKIEEKRMKYINQLSLAQRLGLSEKPPLPLSTEQWSKIEKRNLERQKHKEPCPICYDDLHFTEQSILSCSHVFHKRCLESFERHTKNRGMELCCPICRQERYDKKTYVEGQRAFLIDCVTIIQSVAKGFIQRNEFYQNMKDQGYKPAHEGLRKKFIGFKLGRIGKKQFNEMALERRRVLEMVQI